MLAAVRRRPPVRAIARGAIAPVVAILFCLALVGVFVPAYPKLSPFDEMMHFDSVIKATHFHVVASGERVSHRAEEMQACRGVDIADFTPAACGLAHYTDSQVGGGPFNSAAVHPPGYYFVTAALAHPFQWVGFGLFDAARLVGALWLAGTLLCGWYTVRLLGGSAWAGAGAMAVLASNPLVVLSAGTINNDIGGMFAGGLILLATVAYQRARLRWWWLAAAAFLAMWIKDTSLVPAGAGIIVLLVASRWWRDRALRRPVWIGSAALLVGTVAGGLTWDAVRALIAVSPSAPTPPFVLRQVFSPVNFQHLFGQFTGAIISPTLVNPLADAWIPLLTTFAGWLVVGGCFAAALRLGDARDRAVPAIGMSSLLSLVVGPFVLFAAVSIQQHQVFAGMQPRYGLGMLPFAFALTGRITRTRFGSAALIALGIGLFVADIISCVRVLT